MLSSTSGIYNTDQVLNYKSVSTNRIITSNVTVLLMDTFFDVSLHKFMTLGVRFVMDYIYTVYFYMLLYRLGKFEVLTV